MEFNFSALVPFGLASIFAIGVIIKYADRLSSRNAPLGRMVIIRSAGAAGSRGYAHFKADNGNLVILKVRAQPGSALNKGDRAVIIKYCQADNRYTVVPESEFKGLQTTFNFGD